MRQHICLLLFVFLSYGWAETQAQTGIKFKLTSSDPDVRLSNLVFSALVPDSVFGIVSYYNFITDSTGLFLHYSASIVRRNPSDTIFILFPRCDGFVGTNYYIPNYSLLFEDSIDICSPTVPQPIVDSKGVRGTVYAQDTVTNTTYTPQNAKVYLIRIDSTAYGPNKTFLRLYDSTQTDTGGHYKFENLPRASWYIKAALDTSSSIYSSFLPNYYNSSIGTWSSAYRFISYWHQIYSDIAGPSPYSNYGFELFSKLDRDIFLIQGSNLGGPGFIGGAVSQGANKNDGAAIKAATIMLTNLNKRPLRQALTDANGNYSFSNIPYGSYYIVADIWNRQPVYIPVTISAARPSATNVDMLVGRSAIVASVLPENQLQAISIYPNPVSSELKVSLDSHQSLSTQYQLFDLQGRMLKEGSLQLGAGVATSAIQMSELAKGIYALSFSTAKWQASYRIQKID
jgi:hypothetical protein